MRADALRRAGVGSAAPSDLAHERLERLFETQCDRMMQLGHGNRTAVDTADGILSYAALEAGANQLARYLRLQRVRGGDLVGVLLDHPADVCAAILAISKCGATAVPLDLAASCDHIGAIISESGVAAVITTGPLVSRLPGPESRAATTIVTVDLAGEFISAQSPRRLTDGERHDAGGVAYVAYRIGADGRPIGIAVHHPHVCDFARVVVEGYGIGPYDRVVHTQLVYPHLEVEQTWIPWLAGATLVAPPSRLQGQALWQFLGRHRVTVLRADARTLSGLDERLLELRLVVVTDPPCPQDPIARWQRPGRQVLRAHGHPGSAVVATGSAHRPQQMCSDLARNGTAGRATALGHLASADPTRAVGVGSAAGTLGAAGPTIRRADTDRSAPDDVGGRSRRDRSGASADAAPSTTDDELATALAGVLAGVLDRGQVRVDAHVFDDLGADSLTMAKFCARARAREDLPSPSIQEIYHHPTPAGARGSTRTAGTGDDRAVRRDRRPAGGGPRGCPWKDVPLDADVFDDLGADSLTMAKFCARVRKDPQLPTLAIADVYACPSASGLAERVTGLVGADGSGPTTKPPLAVERRDPGRRVGTGGVALCGLVQIAMVLGWSYLFSLVLFLGYEWFVASPSLFELYRRSFVRAIVKTCG
ncbi:hypothetical protein FRP1_29870 (plasmid) [Pseudonocardia sp. EC080625-04]|nr:hypothetical protein FRP1_29870 [Pseudonocardia sp. EC080625-04]